jgi:hypothetical protein
MSDKFNYVILNCPNCKRPFMKLNRYKRPTCPWCKKASANFSTMYGPTDFKTATEYYKKLTTGKL